MTQVVRTGADSSDIVLNAFGHNHDVHINLPGGYNIYNAAACVAAAEIVGIDETQQLMHSADLSVVSDVRNSLNLASLKHV